MLAVRFGRGQSAVAGPESEHEWTAPCSRARATHLFRARSAGGAEEATDVTALPFERALVLPKPALALEKLRRM